MLRRKFIPGAGNSRGLGREQGGHTPAAPGLEQPQLCSATHPMEIFIGKTLSSFTAQAGDGDGMSGAGAWEGEDGAGAHQELLLLPRKWEFSPGAVIP